MVVEDHLLDHLCRGGVEEERTTCFMLDTSVNGNRKVTKSSERCTDLLQELVVTQNKGVG